MSDPTENGKRDLPERFVLSDELRLVTVLDRRSEALDEALGLNQPPEHPALTGGQSHWERSLTSRGFIPLSLLTTPHALREAIRPHLDLMDEVETTVVEPLWGGHALFEGERLVLTHACCCDLMESLKSWDAASHAHQWMSISYFDIGHAPCVFAHWKAPWLVLEEEDESAPRVNGSSVVTREWRLLPQALELAVSTARQEQEAFARRLEACLTERFSPEAIPEVAATLAGLR